MTYMVVYLRHSDQVLRVRTSSTCECDGPFTQRKCLSPRGLELACHSLWHLTASGLPLFTPGSNGPWPIARARSQSCLHSQVACFGDSTRAPTRTARRLEHQPVGGGGSAALLELAQRPWLSARASAKFVAKINMCMTVSRQRNYCRFIIGWCPSNRSGKNLKT